jgi:addiction module RelB/DinJ family antitoxin
MKTVLNVKTDVDVKERAKSLADHLGIPLSTVVNAYLKNFIETGTFTVSREPELRPKVIARLNKQIDETRSGKNLSPGFATATDALAWLDR